MNLSKIVAGVVILLSSQLCWSQETRPASPHGALGYFDSATGIFRPIGQMEDFDSNSLAAANPQTGTISVNLTITIKSAIPTSSQIICGVTATVTEVSGLGVNIISDEASVVATRTGNTAKCTVTIPYSWAVSNPATAKVNLNYNLAAGKATTGTGLVSRSSTGSIASIPIPANGTTTAQTVNAVL